MIADAATLAAAHRRSLAVARDWREGAPFRALDEAFAHIDPDDAARAADVAERLLRDIAWVSALLDPLIAALADDPWFEPPLKVSRDPLRTGAILYEGAIATVSAVALSADAVAAAPCAETIVASGRSAVVRYVRSGGACLRRWHVADDGLAREIAPLALSDGAVVRQDGRDHAFLLEAAHADVATVTITLRKDPSGYAREYRRRDGVLLKSAALDDAPARTAMLLSLLRLSDRTDAAPAFDRATRADAFFLRWQAMREWLALDAAAAFPRLAEMARDDAHPEIRAAARSTLQLVTQRREAACLA